MAKITITEWLAGLDATAQSSADPHNLYLTYGTLFAIWSDPRGIPAPEWNPDNSPELRPLFAFFNRVDRTVLRSEVDKRINETMAAVAA